MAASRLITGFLFFVALSGPALANMPPKNMDLGNEVMTESQVLKVYRDHFGKRFDRITFHRVKFGGAKKACDAAYNARYGVRYPAPAMWLKPYGCNFSDQDGSHPVIVYSFDPTGKEPSMANHVLRHEFAHELFRWPSNHPNALP